MIVVHHLENSRSQRVLWMLEELGLPYEIRLYKRQPSLQAPDELRAVHPLGKSPVITDGDLVIAESGAILEYLVERYGEGRFVPPAGSPDRLRYRYFLHYAEGSLMPLLFLKIVFMKLPERVPFLMRPVASAISAGADKALLGPQLASHFAFLEGELKGREWFAGDFSAADVQMSFPLEAAGARGGLDRARLPNLGALLDRIHARPAYKRAIEKGGPYVQLK